MMNKTRILCIDDNDRNLRILSELLSDEYELECVRSGEEGLASVKNSMPGLILLDVMMPGMDGYKVCQEVKQNPTTAETPIVLLTAKAGPDEKDHGLRAGADGYLMKPFDPDALLDLVEAYLPVTCED